MMQTVIVGIVVAVTAFLAGRWLLRTIKGKNKGCSCGCDNCSFKEQGSDTCCKR